MRPLTRALVLSSLVYLVGCAATSEQMPASAGTALAFESPISFVSAGDTLRGRMVVAKGAGPHPDDPLVERAGDYDAVSLVPALRDRTVILFGAGHDEQAPITLHYQPLADAFRETGMERLTLVTAPGGHQDRRPHWDATLVEWLREDCFGGRQLSTRGVV